MPSSCPKCHRVLEEDEICCAQVRYTWRCKNCLKLTTGFAVPYGKCFMCGGPLEVIEGRELGDSMRFRAIREAVEFELNSFHFYKLARERASVSAEQKNAESGAPLAGTKGSGAKGSDSKGLNKETKRPGKSAHEMKQAPEKPAADLEDVRRATSVI